jgi:hypothetical protein
VSKENSIKKMKNDPLLSAEENAYLDSLSPKEYQAYLIAKDHLGILLTVRNTNGFLKWKRMKDLTT